MTINRRRIGEGRPVFIVAEAGINHLGRRGLAIRLVQEAAKAGADAIKFQTCRVDQLLPRSSADYAEYRRAALSVEDYRAIASAARDARIVWFSTPLDEPSVDLLERVGVPAYKIASCDVTHRPLLAHVASMRKPVILSSGMADMGEIRRAVAVLRQGGVSQIAVLQCVSQYPAQPANVHLRAMETLRRALRVPVGFSDHTMGIAVPCAAVALGASIIEKHFTLDHALPGDDHRFSVDTHELKALVDGVRCVEQALGSSRKAPVAAERPVRATARRIIVASEPLASGTVLQRARVVFQRPARAAERSRRALSSWEWPQIKGRRLACDVKSEEAVTWRHVGG